jgi:class 3 adenylate cyclase
MVTDAGGQSVAVSADHGRKLIAVVYADMVGYSRLIGLDDAGTFERLQELRRDLIDPALERHGGTLVSTGGDSLLVRFDSITPAMRFAVDVQRGVPGFDGDYAPDRRIRFRMGVNVGDAIPDGTKAMPKSYRCGCAPASCARLTCCARRPIRLFLGVA